MKTPFQSSDFWTNNIELAACLFAVGFKLRQQNPVTRLIEGEKQMDTFWFAAECEESDFGPLRAKTVLDIWKNEGAGREGVPPELIVAVDYMRTAADNRRLMLAAIKTHVAPTVLHRIDGREVYLPLSASPELHAKMRHMISNT